MSAGVSGSEGRSDSTVGLARCPLCGYSLVGLPDHHTCPECGFLYERNAVLFSQMRRSWKVLCIASGMMFLAGIIMQPAWYSVPSPWVVVGAIGVVGFGWRLLEPKKFVLVSRKWLRVCGGSEPEQCYPIEAIERATWSRVDGMVEVFAYGGAVLVRIRSTLLWSHRRSKKLAATITQYASEAALATMGSKDT